jgi:integrase
VRTLLTDRFCGTARHGSFFDEKVTGLTLRVLEGAKTWSFAYTTADGRRTQFKLGSYPALSLAAARSLALEARGLVDTGQDPRTAFGARAGTTVAQLVDSYLSHPDKTKLRTHAELKRRLHKNVVPLIGSIGIVQLHRRDVRRCVDAVLNRGREVEAARVFEDVRALLRWAVERGDLESNPVEAMRKPGGSRPRTRTLTPNEIYTLWNGLPKALARSKACQRIIQLCLVTGQRVGEVAGMEVAELEQAPLEMTVSKGELTVRSINTKQWKIPGRRTKNGYVHNVPLTDLAVEIVNEAIADADKSPFVFPAGAGSLPAQAVARTILRAQSRFGLASWSAHDLRRTALNSMASLGVAPHILGHVANHRSVTRATVTTQHYVTHRYEAEVRAALELWSAQLRAIVSDQPTAKVIPIGGAR